ncbi:alpha/beta fold hydrolase [Streptomyces boluensis]|uniref:Alpha/beta fold hydrolase n=1 Tax=Streptomyces boluensis TaxID=1775135 RepID=A0A964XK23_9ACTN|nr:alpha/beta hydrolase [Streptomyces boluensis]NBE51924.1 alpha/beta fold hydrolase [Streptomyces boluensis]
MSAPSSSPTPAPTSYKNTPNRSVSVRGVTFAYRQLGPDDGVPLILLNHLAAVLDNWDPRVVDGLAARRPVITFDNRGVGASSGSTPDTVEAMARDAVLFIRALGYDQVDLLGLSMGGFIAQVIAAEEPDLVRKLILAGTGPAGGPGIDKVTAVTIKDILKAVLTRKDPKQYLFFTGTSGGRRAAQAFVNRLKERTDDRDKAISVSSFRAQLKAIRRWGLQEPADLSRIHQPVLVANGESDRMVPSVNSVDLAARLPQGELEPLYPDAGHGGIFQRHDLFVPRALEFLEP